MKQQQEILATHQKMRRPAMTWRYVVAMAFLTCGGTLGLLMLGLGGETQSDYHTPQWALVLHLGTVFPALVIGGFLVLSQKGTQWHRALGRVWAALMIVTAIASIWVRDLTGGFSPIHLFTVVTLVGVPYAVWSAARGDIDAHQRAMIGTFIGLVLAGAFALLPGRIIGNMLLAVV